MRYFIGQTPLWTFETTEYTLLFITFLATAWLLKEEGHVKMDLLLNQFSRKNQAIISTFTSSIGTVMFLIITWYSSKVVWEVTQTHYYLPSILEVPATPIYIIIPIGSFLLFIQFLRRTCGYIMDWKAPLRNSVRIED